MSDITAYCADDRVLAEHTTRRNDVEYFRCPACDAGGKAHMDDNGGVTAVFDDEDGHTPLVFLRTDDDPPEDVTEYEADEDGNDDE